MLVAVVKLAILPKDNREPGWMLNGKESVMRMKNEPQEIIDKMAKKAGGLEVGDDLFLNGYDVVITPKTIELTSLAIDTTFPFDRVEPETIVEPATKIDMEYMDSAPWRVLKKTELVCEHLYAEEQDDEYLYTEEQVKSFSGCDIVLISDGMSLSELLDPNSEVLDPNSEVLFTAFNNSSKNNFPW